MAACIIPVKPFDLVIFGATGDLAIRKLLPALYRRDAQGQILPASKIFGLSRSQLSTEEFRAKVLDGLKKFVSTSELDDALIDRFLARLQYEFFDVTTAETWKQLKSLIPIDAERIRVFYLSVAPSLFGNISKGLAENGFNTINDRLVVEKPFGRDYDSAKSLNEQIGSVFPETSIYRIDHYLGKETVQNLMALRFSNTMFEPLWNSQYIDHVQITAAESIGVGSRGAYYDQSGVIRDMVQNHLMQLLCLIAMEPPYAFVSDAIRDEKLKVLRALRPLAGKDVLRNTVRAQYGASTTMPSYKAEAGNPNSTTETFVAIKAEVNNWRWAGVPFYLRSGKNLRTQMTEIAIVFKQPAYSVFQDLDTPIKSNTLVIRLQPDEGLKLGIMTKDPGPGGFRLRDISLDMSFAQALGKEWRMPEAYERLLMDVVRGNQTLFMRRDEVELAWQWVDPIIEAWETYGQTVENYDIGSNGPIGSIELMARDNRRWRDISL